MLKILSVLIFISCLPAMLMGQQLRSEKIGDRTALALLLPYSGFRPNLQTGRCNYDLKLDILDSGKKNIYHNFVHLEFSKPDSFDTEVYPIFVSRVLKPGKYHFYMQLTNRDLGDKNEQKFTFQVAEVGKKIGTLYLVGNRNGANFWVSSIINFPHYVDSLHLYANLGIVPDSIKIFVEDGMKSTRTDISPRQVIDQDIKSYLNGMQHPIIKLQIYAQKVKYTKEVLPYNAISNFRKIYSLDDQVLQLKYIMNQNELRYMKSVAPAKYAQTIDEFWKMKDPTPDTKRNEFRENFEARVMESDRNYSIRNYRPGWQTDRGKIFIKYGPPDEVVADAYPMNKPPYIIWYYYTENKIFQFDDISGWGNYQLGSVSDE